MRSAVLVSVALSVALLACSQPEPPPPPAKPAAAEKPKRAPLDDAAKEARANKVPAQPLPTIAVHPPADAPADPRRAETPCDRHEKGWKWVGTVVDNGKCAVGPCDCVKG